MGIYHNVATRPARPSPIPSPRPAASRGARQQVLQRHQWDGDRKASWGGGAGGVRVGGGGLNESYSYAFSFTSIRIHNWEAGEGDRREEFSRVEWRHTPACIQNSPYTEGCRWHHCTYVTLLMTSLAHSLSSVAFKAFFPSHAQLPPTHKYLPAVTVWVLCTFSG